MASAKGNKGLATMDLPAITLDQLPGLDGAPALFGAVLDAGGANDDRIVDIMVYIYEILPPDAVI